MAKANYGKFIAQNAKRLPPPDVRKRRKPKTGATGEGSGMAGYGSDNGIAKKTAEDEGAKGDYLDVRKRWTYPKRGSKRIRKIPTQGGTTSV